MQLFTSYSVYVPLPDGKHLLLSIYVKDAGNAGTSIFNLNETGQQLKVDLTGQIIQWQWW